MTAAEKQRWKFLRETWLKQIAQDVELPFHVYKIAYFLAARVNDKTHEFYPSADKLSKRIRCQPTLIRGALDLLAKRGHIAELKTHWETRAKYYRPMINQKTAP